MQLHYPTLQQYLTHLDHIDNTLQPINQWFTQLDDYLYQTFEQNHQCIRQVVSERTQAIDQILIYLWKQAELDQNSIALFAVGGYGRQEMLPYSDADILLFSEHDLTPEQEQRISQFISSLWDIKVFKPAVSVRTLQQCIEDAKSDITIATSLIEARLIFGEANIARFPRQIVSHAWTDETFYEAKLAEQQQRYAQHNYTGSSVEPDIKNSPGGLRDIHLIGWIAKRHFRVNRLFDLTHLGFLSEYELKQLEDAEDFLWAIRYYLHSINKRDENRLLFDFQSKIAEKFGFIVQENRPKNEPIELFMRQYYRIAQRVSTLNEIILSYFREAIIMPRLANYQRQKIDLNQNFKLVDGQLAVQHHKVFSERPKAILELFYLWANREDVIGIRARTLRLLLLATQYINEDFRNNPEHHHLFLQILRSNPRHLYKILVAMKRYGVLGRYIPTFGKITGLMQYDLFHTYTVDAHTLLLVRNLTRFSRAEYADQFPIVSAVYQQLPRYDLLFLAAIFHDIAKGRGGDHSVLGAEDALEFCRLHGLNERDSQLVAWLIRYHLLMSVTAQKKDISDPEVVHDFAKKIISSHHLEYLYCLTVADINATNPKLWNSWRASLLKQLYLQAKEILTMGQPIDPQEVIDETKQTALQALLHDYTQIEVEQLWQNLGDDYFLKENADDIIWHSRAILRQQQYPLILIRPHPKVAQDAVQIFIYTPDQAHLFAKTVNVFERMDLDVVDAKIITSNHGFSLDSYVVFDSVGTLTSDELREREVKQAIIDVLTQPEFKANIKKCRVPRQLRHMNVKTQVKIHLNATLQQTVLEIITLDQPGLLAKIGAIFVQAGLEIHSARIATFGERAEDIFFVTQNSQALTTEQATEFTQQLSQILDEFAQQWQQS